MEKENDLRLNRELTLQKYKKGYSVKGKTRKYRDDLKALGGKWNRYINAWVFSDADSRQLLIDHFTDPEKELESRLLGGSDADIDTEVKQDDDLESLGVGSLGIGSLGADRVSDRDTDSDSDSSSVIRERRYVRHYDKTAIDQLKADNGRLVCERDHLAEILNRHHERILELESELSFQRHTRFIYPLMAIVILCANLIFMPFSFPFSSIESWNI